MINLKKEKHAADTKEYVDYIKKIGICTFENGGIEIINLIENLKFVEKKKDKVEILMKLIEMIVSEDVMMVWINLRYYFVRTIGFSIPSNKALDTITEWINNYLNVYPKSKFIDVGAGSGVWELLLHYKGIDKDKLLAIDLPLDKKTHIFEYEFWDILEVIDYEVNANDILFIAWGDRVGYILENYVNNDGKCVIILGESDGGATLPADILLSNKKYKTLSVNIPASCSYLPELLTLNILKTDKELLDQMEQDFYNVQY